MKRGCDGGMLVGINDSDGERDVMFVGVVVMILAMVIYLGMYGCVLVMHKKYTCCKVEYAIFVDIVVNMFENWLLSDMMIF